MGWFDSQIKERVKAEDSILRRAYWSLASVINKKTDKTYSAQYGEENDALFQICNYYKVEHSDLDDVRGNINERMERLLRTAGVMRRRITLKGRWWEDLSGPVLAERKSGGVTAVLKGKGGRFYYQDVNGKKIPIGANTADQLKPEAVCFYKALPLRPLKPGDIFRFLLQSVEGAEKRNVTVAGLVVTLLGLITPYMTNLLFSAIIPTGQSAMIYSVGCFMAGAAFSKFMLEAAKSMIGSGMERRMKNTLESAVFARIMNLPAAFFKKYSSGELAERVIVLNSVCTVISDALLRTGLTALFSLTYIIQIFSIAPSLVLPAFFILLGQLAAAILGMLGQLSYIRKKLDAGAKVQGIVFSLFSGIQKIKTAGGEKRAFDQWASRYREEAEASFNPPLFLKMQNALAPVISILGTLLIYGVCITCDVEVSQYAAFQTAFGMVSSAVLNLTGSISSLAAIKPVFELAGPILEATPESGEEKETVTSLFGAVELNHVTFQYTEDGPNILEDLSLKIKKGQYVAIVGRTGCGKSTLMRILLGFETPKTGAVYYDGKDLVRLDQKSLCQNIGVVMQNGKLFQGDIYSNITISAPGLSVKEAWEAAEMAGVAEDIRNMPMGMHTVLSEGAGGISGGQRQRLMIARAVAPKPKLLLFDEATSALDNVTQKQVSESLNRMHCTRIVIAHRLSTIRECDRIIVLDHGNIIEDGSYEELAGRGGFFSELVARQQVQAEQ
ncbi:MAG: ATP-binding cassette domain-containing protein [Lachnospiraceae bacterium]|nr:ATP-binding cassette domain-containing protein [Lachnospiraceae bacterium]